MDFQELLEQADYNVAVSQTGGKSKDGIKRYSTVLPPPKKLSKANVQSDNIRRFLAKRKAEEAAKIAEAKRERERLLAIRAQNSKNNKKAKIMASRTKDNDFSKIILTDDEKEALKRREAELIRKNLADKVERMKARIEMQEKEAAMPKKRKRKSKNGEVVSNMIDQDDLHNGHNESSNMRRGDSYQPEKEKVRKPKPPPAPPAMSFTELLKIAEKRQVQPVEIAVKKKEEHKLLTKREKKIQEEELARLKRKQEKLLEQKSGLSKPSNSPQVSSLGKKNVSEKEENKKPVVIHVKSDPDAKFKIPKSAVNVTKEVTSNKHKNVNSTNNSKSVIHSSNSLSKPLKNSLVDEQKKVTKIKDDSGSSVKSGIIKKRIALPKKNELKSNPVQMAPKKQPNPVLDEEALNADIERKVQERLTKEREKLAKEIEEQIAAKFAQFQNMQPKVIEKVPEAPKPAKKEPVVERKIAKKMVEKPQSGFYRKDMERMIALRKEAIAKSSLKPKLPEKPFHKNPYLDPPRRLLESQRPNRPPVKRRIESDDDDDDDDMSDFIDDGISQNDEDYSKYIKEIFGYDRNRYLDEDDDDEVMETSFEQQQKEEIKSARLGYLEDLEEEKLEMERRKKKKVKK